MASFSSLSDVDLEKQVAQLSKELKSMKKQLSKRGNHYYEEGREALSEYYEDISSRIGDHMPDIRRQARAIENTAREHPAAAVAVGLVVIGLAASFLFSRR